MIKSLLNFFKMHVTVLSKIIIFSYEFILYVDAIPLTTVKQKMTRSVLSGCSKLL